MLRKLILTAAAMAALGMLAGCGSPGAPQPPSLLLPTPPQDLSATRKGNKVTLSWTPSRETTDGETLRSTRLGATYICRGHEFPLNVCGRVGELPAEKTPIPQVEKGAPRVQFTDTLPGTAGIEFLTYGIEATNFRGRSAGLSNQVRVPAVATPPVAEHVTARVQADGIVFSWNTAEPPRSPYGVRFQYRLVRREEGGRTVAVADLPVAPEASADTLVDRSFVWEKTYFYHVTPVSAFDHQGKHYEIEGDDSPEIKVLARDAFPPAIPVGLQAVASGPGQKPFIDLTWAPNTDEDLAGYNVYRSEASNGPVKINSELVASPSFRDDDVAAGREYVYVVTAVDLRKNESGKSEPASESIPK